MRRVAKRARLGFDSLEQRALLTSFTLDSQGNLFASTAAGSIKIDTGVASFSVASNGTMYDRHANDQMNQFKNNALLPFDSNVISFVVDKNASIYDLHADGILHLYNPASASAPWSLVSGGVVALGSADMGGSVWFLELGGGTVAVTGDSQGTRVIGSGATKLLTAESGRSVYVLMSNGNLYRGSDALGGIAMVDTAVSWTATADQGGSVWYVKSSGGVYVTGDGRGTRLISGAGSGLVTAESGNTVYVLLSNGALDRGSDALGGMIPVDTGVTQMATADLGGSLWYIKSSGGTVFVTGDGRGTRQVSASGSALLTAESGRTVYVLLGTGALYRGSDAIGGMALVDSGVSQMATADLGASLWYLKNVGGSLLVTGDAAGQRGIANGVTTIQGGDDGLSVYILESNGTLYRGSDALGGMVYVRTFTPGSPGLQYHGGPLLTNIHVEAVFLGTDWTTNPLDAQLESQINSFLAALVVSPYMNLLSEYSEPGYAIGAGQFVGSYQAGNVAMTSTSSGKLIKDSTIQTTLNGLINGGHFPPNPNNLYCVFTPPGANVDAAPKGVGGYHSALSFGLPLYYYAVLPDPLRSQGWLAGFGQLSSTNMNAAFQVYTEVASHEIAEAVTDPNTNKVSGWYDYSIADWPFPGSGGEIGDLAEGYPQFGTLYMGTPGQSVSYVVSNLWSKMLNKKVLSNSLNPG
jgi:hypothetical protein